MVYRIKNMTPEMVMGAITADVLAGWADFFGDGAIDKNKGIFVRDIRRRSPKTPHEVICDLVLAREGATVTLAAIAEPFCVKKYIEPVIGLTYLSAIQRVLWDAIPTPTDPDAERVRAWLDAQDQEARLTRIERTELEIVRGWPEAKRNGVKQVEYCANEAIEPDTLRAWRDKYKRKGYEVGW